MIERFNAHRTFHLQSVFHGLQKFQRLPVLLQLGELRVGPAVGLQRFPGGRDRDGSDGHPHELRDNQPLVTEGLGQ